MTDVLDTYTSPRGDRKYVLTRSEGAVGTWFEITRVCRDDNDPPQVDVVVSAPTSERVARRYFDRIRAVEDSLAEPVSQRVAATLVAKALR